MQPATLEKPGKPDGPGPLLCSITEMRAALGGLSPRHAYRLLADGTFETRYIGRRRMVVWQSVVDYVNGLPTERDDGD